MGIWCVVVCFVLPLPADAVEQFIQSISLRVYVNVCVVCVVCVCWSHSLSVWFFLRIFVND